MKILKFGGSSIGDAERIKSVIELIKASQEENAKIAVVFSAFQGVTDNLIHISRAASKGDTKYVEQFRELEKKHINTIKELINITNQSSSIANLKMSLNELEDVLHGVYLIKELSYRTLDLILSFGERLSAYIISCALNDRKINCEYLDSRELIKTDNNFGNAKVDLKLTYNNIRNYFKSHIDLQAITGFIGSTEHNETTTLGRGGSDYTASIFAAALGAKEIEIWTDVDGVLTADPKKVKKALSLKQMTYEEAMELSHFGAKVIHPPTMQPAMNNKIPIRIRNTFNPAFEGTVIGAKVSTDGGFIIKGISSIDKVALINVQGSGLIGVAGIARRIFGALAAQKINVILISQASSEHSICFAVLPESASLARKTIIDELRYEINVKLINEPSVENDLSIIAVVGENMKKTPGISGRVFQSLGKNGINIIAIAQGSSELNISIVISKEDESKALNVLHDAFFLSIAKTVNLFIVGTGLIGGTLLRQINSQEEYLAKEYSLSVNIRALANSRKMLLEKNGIDTSKWFEKLNSSETKTNLSDFIDYMIKLNLPNSIFVECTASDDTILKYKEILDASISVVTPNKKANAAGYDFYLQLKQSAVMHNVRFAYETNVGAGLPIISTIRDLVSSGDEVLKIEGVLSGTLSFIFNSFTSEKSFSEIIKEAKERGYTEPDPRDDLNGIDVARKLLILAREIGLIMELKDIKIENLVPEPARNTKSVDEFFSSMKKFDGYFEEKRKKAEAKNKVLRYIAILEKREAKISLEEVDSKHSFYSLSANDNIIAITTKHYKERPIVIKGPGAGADVTAAGVFADIIRISNYLS